METSGQQPIDPDRIENAGLHHFTPNECGPFTVIAGQLAMRSAPGGIRTPNLLIRSQMLYPLSYRRLFSWTWAGAHPGRCPARKRRDLNPRCPYEHNTLAVCPIRPLWHASRTVLADGHRAPTLPAAPGPAKPARPDPDQRLGRPADRTPPAGRTGHDGQLSWLSEPTSGSAASLAVVQPSTA